MLQATPRRPAIDALPAPKNLACRWHVLPGNAGKGGGLPRAIGANERHAFARLHLKTNTLDSLDTIEMLDQIFDLQRHAEPFRRFIKPSRPEGASTMINITNNPNAPRQ